MAEQQHDTRPLLGRCATCGMAVVLTEGEQIRACRCDGAITVDVQARMAGVGGMRAR